MISILMMVHLSCQQTDPLETYLKRLPASLVVSYHVQSPEGEVFASKNAIKQVPAASIIKIPILVELMRQVEHGELALENELVLSEAAIVSGAGTLQHQPVGSSYTLEYLAREMIRTSDNVATNLLIGQVGMESVNRWLEENGYSTTRLNRLMMDFDAIAEGRQNFTSAEEIARMLAEMYNMDYLSKSSTDFVMELLIACADRTTIPSKLPAGVQVAHKTGTLDYIRGDAGIILGEKPLVLAVFVEGFDHMDQAEEVIGEVAKIAWETYAN